VSDLTPPEPIRIGYLGPLEVVVRGRVVQVRGQRLRSLLVRLALDVGRPVPVGDLVEAVWGGGGPAGPANALQSLISRLRAVLDAPHLVRQAPTGYRLDLPPEAVDGPRFARLAAAGRAELAAGDAQAAAGTLRSALDLWRGDPLSDLDDTPALEPERAALLEAHLRATSDRIAADLRLGRAGDVLAEVEALAGSYPLREDLVGLRMQALVDVGRPAQALVAYDLARRHLAQELGADPSPQLRARHQEVLALPSPRGPVRTNLRAVVTSFVGRDDDVRAVRDRLLTGRLVTVVGAGGCGKTRLATEVAALSLAAQNLAAQNLAAQNLAAQNVAAQNGAERGGAGLDGVWFVDLAPVNDPEAVVQAALEAVGRRETLALDQHADRRRLSPVDRLMESLGGIGVLLVMDNCEHLIDAAAALVADLLARCPGVRVIATSREPLGVDGEVLYPLTPLAVPPSDAPPSDVAANPAARLLVDRARAVGAHIDLDGGGSDAESVLRIVRRLDGLPLAIELAAARTRVLALPELADRLADRFRLLTGGRRTVLPRHRTLRAVVEWSWDLLTPAERGVAEHFSVFVGGAATAGVAAVCPARPGPEVDLAGDVTDVLHALVDKSLLVADLRVDGTRFRMLETLREYGTERLVKRGLVEAARSAHARYYADLAATADGGLRGPGQVDSLRILETERDNLLAALEHLGECGDASGALDLAVHLGWSWMMRENGRDADRWLGFALAVPGAQERDRYPVAQALRAVSAIATPTDEPVRADWTSDAVGIADRLSGGGEDYPPARLLRPLLLFFARRGDAARVLLGRAVEEDPDPWVRAACRMIRVLFAENDGGLGNVRGEVEIGLAEWEAIGDRWGMAALLTARSQLRTLDGDLDGAAADLTLAQRHLGELGLGVWDDLMVTMSLADLRLRAGDVRGARRHLESMRNGRSYPQATLTRSVLVEVMDATIALAESADPGVVGAVRERLVSALEVAPEPTPFQAHAGAVGRATVARLDLRLGEVARATAQARHGYRLARLTEDLPIVAATGLATAELALALGRAEDGALVLGAAARLRGSEDVTNPVVVVVTRALREVLGVRHDGHFADGLAMDREEAIARLDPALLGRADEG
jgi:predicted ATPase/DNA-binding SARP family transcriptional activator